MNTRSKNIVFVFYLFDLLILTISFFLVLNFKYEAPKAPEYISSVYFTLLVNWLIIIVIGDPQRLFLRERLFNRLRAQVFNFLIFVGLVSSVIFILKLGHFSRLLTFGTIGVFFVLKTVFFCLLYLWLGYRRRKGRQMAQVLVIGAGREGCRYFKFTEDNPEMGYKVVGFLVDDKQKRYCDIEDLILGKVEDIGAILENQYFDEVVIALPLVERDMLREVIGIAEFYGKRIRMIPDFYRIVDRRFRITSIGEIPMVNVREIPLDSFGNFFFKRILDLFLSTVALIILFVPMLIIAILIKLDSKGPIFYKPIRVSRGGREFKMLKFRTMIVDHSKVGVSGSTILGDPRITKVGKYLRKFNVDELPQILNVLLNDMSIVGPRPHRVELNTDMQHSVMGYMLRHYIKPGITGWAQVNGWRGPTETKEQRDQRTQHDLWYIENWTFWLDIKIVWMTAFSKSAYKNAF